MKVAVVGGGITGLSTALFLRERGAELTLIEAGPSIGGLSVAAGPDEFGPVRWDRFYHVVTPADRDLLDLVARIGLGGDVVWTPTSQGIYMEGAIRPLRGPADLLRLPRLSLLEKLRLGATAALARFAGDGPQLDQMTSAEWLARRCGRGGYDKLWQYLLRAKLGGAAEKVSARFIHATLRRLGKARGSSGGSERFGYVRGGYGRVLDTLARHLDQIGVRCVTGTKVATVTTAAGDGVDVTGAEGTFGERFDRVVVTLPNTLLPDLLPELDGATAERLQTTSYLGVACTVAVGRQSLGKDYILNLCDPGFAITGVIEMSNVVRAEEEFGGRGLVYLPRYDVRGSAPLQADDATIADQALADLQRVHPAAGNGWLAARSVQRAGLIQPLPMVGAPPPRPPRTVVPARVFVVNNAQLEACVLNNNDCVALARGAVADVLG